MLLIKNGYIKTMAGPDLPAGCVLIGDDGKIAAVGMDISAPEGAQVIDAEVPTCLNLLELLGLVVVVTLLGIAGIDLELCS